MLRGLFRPLRPLGTPRRYVHAESNSARGCAVNRKQIVPPPLYCPRTTDSPLPDPPDSSRVYLLLSTLRSAHYSLLCAHHIRAPLPLAPPEHRYGTPRQIQVSLSAAGAFSPHCQRTLCEEKRPAYHSIRAIASHHLPTKSIPHLHTPSPVHLLPLPRALALALALVPIAPRHDAYPAELRAGSGPFPTDAEECGDASNTPGAGARRLLVAQRGATSDQIHREPQSSINRAHILLFHVLSGTRACPSDCRLTRNHAARGPLNGHRTSHEVPALFCSIRAASVASSFSASACS